MKKLLLPAIALAATCSVSALAQPANSDNNSAVKETHTVNADGPSRGANSFTEGEARGHIENAGFTHVSKLSKDNDGVWRGTAIKHGHRVSVAVDFKGDVTTVRR
jgi:putative membrane protein